MKKTTVYLTEDAAARLRQLATSSGRAQADLVRDAITEYVAKTGAKRPFLSAGAGSSKRKRGTSVADEDLDTAIGDLIEERLKGERSWPSSSTPAR